MNSWHILEDESDFKKACKTYEEVKYSAKGSEDHKEKLLLAFLINQYEEKNISLPEADPVELIKIRMEEFHYL